MLTEDKITEIFIMADDFCKVFNETLRRRGLMKVNPGRKRNYHSPNRMSDAGITVIMIMFHSSSHKCLNTSICKRYAADTSTSFHVRYPTTVLRNRRDQ